MEVTSALDQQAWTQVTAQPPKAKGPQATFFTFF